MNPLPSTLLQAVASLTARRAGEHVLRNLHRRDETTAIHRGDVKHKLDVESQEIATTVINAAFPDHALLGEETCDHPLQESDYLWIVDPIDGTVNFFHGLPLWCCSVAVRYRGQTMAAAVFAPELNQMYEATVDTPATCNGNPLRVSDNSSMELSMIATGAGKWDKEERTFRYLRRVAEIAQRPRVLGAAALDLCMVAAGRVDGYFQSDIFLWDMAAGSLIVKQAGGSCDILRQGPDYHMAVLATNGLIHAECQRALQPMLDTSP